MDDFFALPLGDRHFEDYPVGLVAQYGTIVATADDIVRFAEAFDPHRMHTDPEATTTSTSARNQHDELVMTQTMLNLMLRRPAAARSLAIRSSGD